MLKKNEYIRVFRAFSDENRIRVLELLCDGEKCACLLLEDLNIGQSTLSHHMKILCDSGIVKSRPVGKWSYYSINDLGCAYGRELLAKLTESNFEKMNFFSQKLYKILFPFRCIIKCLYNIHSVTTVKQVAKYKRALKITYNVEL